MHAHGGHSHDSSAHPIAAGGDNGPRTLVVIVAVIGVLTAIGLVALWPTEPIDESSANLAGLRFPDAEVTAVERGECPNFETTALGGCDLVTLTLTSGPDADANVEMEVPDVDRSVPDLAPGDRVVLQHNPLAPDQFAYSFWEFQRRTPLLALAALFVVAVVAFGRWQGVRALAGLGVSAGVVVAFLLPALLEGRSSTAVALVAASVIAFSAVYLAHGVNLNSTVALVGTLLSLVVITTLAAVFISAAHLTGLSGDDVQLLSVAAADLDPAGILLAGFIIGTLGVLDDVTVTQVSIVSELRDTDPEMSAMQLYRRALRVGRDHIAATVNTLVLAYVGASLSILIFLVQAQRGLFQVLGQEIVAIEIVRTLVGGIGLVAAVPITTALAALIATRAAPPGDTAASWDQFEPDQQDLGRWHDG